MKKDFLRLLRACKRYALLLPTILIVANGALAAQPPQTGGDTVPPAKVTLAECLRIAMQHQPALAGHQASVAAATAQRDGLNKIPIPSCLSRELAVRRKQSELGVTIAAAGLDQSEQETIYAVTRTYIAVLFARRQEAVAREAADKLKLSRQNADRLSKAGNPDFVVTRSDVEKLDVYIALAETRRLEAVQGTQRAVAALREAMGVGLDSGVEPADGPIPNPRHELNLNAMIQLALSRRGELIQATNVSEAVALEIQAQCNSHKLKKETFAAVVDIHARQIPQGSSNGEYRPGALGLEMPTLLAGPKSARVERAQDLHDRALAVVDKTRNLITLEVEDAFAKWQEAARKLAALRNTPDLASKLADNLQQRFSEKGNVPAEDVVRSYLVAAQSQASYNEALYQQALGLAALERITAGGFNAGLVGDNPAKP
ncbi:MAG TPA: TolC family protein [Gemmataceae bacterium]|jgi:outer membrane protein TolC|nr:TolC family protein [Gemmataceae bacterium]